VQPLLELLQGEESDRVRFRATKSEEKPWWMSHEEYRWLDYVYAISALGNLGAQQAVEPLIAYLQRKPPKAVEPVIPDISEKSLFSWEWEPPDEPVWHQRVIRVQLIETLAELAGTHVTEILCEVLANNYGDDVSRAAASALDDLKDQRAIGPLVNALSFGGGNLHFILCEILFRFASDELVAELIRVLSSGSESLWLACRRVISLLGRLKATQAVEPLLAKLSSEEDLIIREDLILALGEIGSSQAVEPLYLLLQEFDGIPDIPDDFDEHHRIYSALYLALAQLGDERVFALLLEALSHENGTIQSRAIEGLAALGGQRAVEALISHLRNRKAWESTYSASTSLFSALTELGDQQAVEPLCELLTTSPVEEDSRSGPYTIVKALEMLGDRSAVPALMVVFQRETAPESALRKDRFALTAEYAARALGNLGDPQASKVLISYLKGSSHIKWDIASYIVEALGKLGDPAALPVLKWVLRFDSNKILELSPKARMDYRIYEVKEKAQEAIGRIMEITRR
jgi:HEAT repeat protein